MPQYVVRLEKNPEHWKFTGGTKYGAMVHATACRWFLKSGDYSRWLPTRFKTPEAARDGARAVLREKRSPYPVRCCLDCIGFFGCYGCHRACRY